MSLPSYPQYKDSGVEWLGEVPEHWEVTRLKFVASVQTGVAKGKDNTAKETVEVPYLRVANVQDGYLALDDIATIEIPIEDLARYRLQPGDVLMNEGGDFDKLGRGHIWNGEIEDCIHQNHVFAVRPTAVSSLWLNKVTSSGYAQFYFMTRSKQSTNLASISSTNIMELPLVLPPGKEQDQILHFLDNETGKIDALIGEQEQLLTLLAEKRQATISHAVTRGLNPAAPLKDSGVEWLGQVPAHWDILRLNNLFKEVIESGEDDLPILSVSIHDGVSDKELNDEELDRKVSRSDDRSKYKKVMPGDLVYNMMRAWQGGFGTVKTVGMVSPAYVVARPTRQILTNFIECLLRTPNAVTEMKRRSRGVTDFRLRLYWEEFKEIQVAIPPFSEQCKIINGFTGYLSHIEKLGNEATRAIELLKERRSALISAAVTGKIDVRDAVVEEVTA